MLKIILIRWDFEVLCIRKLYPLFCFVLETEHKRYSKQKYQLANLSFSNNRSGGNSCKLMNC